MIRWAAGAALLFIGVAGVVLVAASDPRSAAGALSIAVFGIMACAGHALLVTGIHFSARRLIMLAVALRLLAFPLGPSLSDDAYRYLWDGLVQVDGANPYLTTPAETPPEARPTDGRFEDLNSADYFSVYPPASQFLFAISGWMARTLGWEVGYYVMKGVMVILEMSAILLLLQLASPVAAAIYALHPLAIIEIAGQGHSEGLAISALIACIWCVRRRKAGWAGVLWAMAVWTKLIPVLIWPLIRVRNRRLAVAAAVTTAVLWWPYFSPEAVANISESLRLYAGTFDFFSVPFWLLDAVMERATAALVLRVPLVLGLICAGLWLLKKPDRWIEAGLAVISLFIVTSTTIHPWYLLLVLCLLPFVARTPIGGFVTGGWLWFGAASVGSYAFYGGHLGVYELLAFVGWAGLGACVALALFLLAIPYLLRRRASEKADWIMSALPAERNAGLIRLIDIGAGEGYVAEALSARLAATGGKVEPILVDTENHNCTALTWRKTEGSLLPLDNASADLIICSYVLHHTSDAKAIVREAVRSLRTGGTIAILESVFESEFEHRLLARLDFLANRLRTLTTRPPILLNHRTAKAWRRALEDAGLTIEHLEERRNPFHRRLLIVATKT
ncbi:hypothetical protein BH23BAC4_BH23BAC4_15650 [soil metagenome]